MSPARSRDSEVHDIGTTPADRVRLAHAAASAIERVPPVTASVMRRFAESSALAAVVVASIGACELRDAVSVRRVPVAIPAVTTAGAEAPAPDWPPAREPLARRLMYEPLEIPLNVGAGGGVSGARRLQLVFPSDGHTVTIKWKISPRHDADGWNNSPRKELAAYVMQQWFLDPEDYVVPTSFVRCIPLAQYRVFKPDIAPTIRGTQCVLGFGSVWLEDVFAPDPLYEAERFATDPVYATHFADCNLLTCLIEHRDGRRVNFLATKREEGRRIFTVDNGITFGALVYDFFVRNWDQIRVPKLPKRSIDRLRRISATDISALAVLVEMRADEAGVLRPVRGESAMNLRRGVRVARGRVQLGLTAREIDGVARRLRHLLERVDAGEVPVF